MTEAELLREEPPGYGGPRGSDAMAIYLRDVEQAQMRGDATEHTHRPTLKALLEALDDRIIATNEPKRSACGAPDYVIARRRDRLSLGYVESKDVGADLDAIERGGQLGRYRTALPNLLLTDYRASVISSWSGE
jgi:hypothetical protein